MRNVASGTFIGCQPAGSSVPSTSDWTSCGPLGRGRPVVRPPTERGEKVAVVRKQSLEDIVVALAVPATAVEFPFHRVADANPFVGSCYLALTSALTRLSR
jgi:hypothetical protein